MTELEKAVEVMEMFMCEEKEVAYPVFYTNWQTIKNYVLANNKNNKQSTPCSCKTTVTILPRVDISECDNCGAQW